MDNSQAYAIIRDIIEFIDKTEGRNPGNVSLYDKIMDDCSKWLVKYDEVPNSVVLYTPEDIQELIG